MRKQRFVIGKNYGKEKRNKKMPTASQLPRPSIEGTEKVDNTAYI